MIHYSFIKASQYNSDFVLDCIQKIYQIKLQAEKFQEMYQIKINDSDSYMIIAIDQNNQPQGLIVGHKDVLLNLNYFSATITDFYILPGGRKQNLASLLYDYFELELSRQGIFHINVSCNITGTLTQNFYRKKGFIFSKKTFAKTIY